MNTFGEQFRLTTFGESHGATVGGVIDGCPAGIQIDMHRIEEALRRRREGDTSLELFATEGLTTTRKEPDQVEWLSGLLEGVTLGTPIAFMVRNKECRSEDYDSLKKCQRPGHADYTYQTKYGIRDPRGGGRSSARETVSRVVAGAIALQVLELHTHIRIQSAYDIPALMHPTDRYTDSTTFGGSVACSLVNVPAGWGEPIFGKLNARLAAAMMSIPSATAFEIGSGVRASSTIGEQYTDPWTIAPQQLTEFEMEDFEHDLHAQCHAQGRITLFNHCGGIQGGIANGDPIVFRVHFHPVATHTGTMRCRTDNGRVIETPVRGRHDKCHVLRCPVIVESMAALVLVNELLRGKL